MIAAEAALRVERVAVDDARRQIIVTFSAPISGQLGLVDPRNYRLSGGETRHPRIVDATLHNPRASWPELRNRRVRLQLDRDGDASLYTLNVHAHQVDPLGSGRTLRFHLDHDQAVDCRVTPSPPPPEPQRIPIDYLSKDYASFRQALLDFLLTRMPTWTERSEADIGIMLLELLAATADELSYMQDRVSSEAFLSTATQRRSVTEHLALFDFVMLPGAVAYTWLAFSVPEEVAAITLPSYPGLRVSTKADRGGPVVVFETAAPARLLAEHNQLRLYSWQAAGTTDAQLNAGATSATLVGRHERLRIGDYLILQDSISGVSEQVRLTGRPSVQTIIGFGEVTVVQWSTRAALSNAYAVADTVVFGNVVFATHGETVEEELYRPPTRPQLRDQLLEKLRREPTPDELAELECRPLAQGRLRLALGFAPLAYLDPPTTAMASPPATLPAEPAVLRIPTRVPIGASTLRVYVDAELWQERTTLLMSSPEDQVYRVQIDDDGIASVEFGDGVLGAQPAATSVISAIYRVGGGDVGNVGPDTLKVILPDDRGDLGELEVTNLLPAKGGSNVETSENARQYGPTAVKQQLVAVTGADYEDAVVRYFVDADGQKPIRRARAETRWAGSWVRTRLLIQPMTDTLDADQRAQLRQFLDGRRLAGVDLEVQDVEYVPVDLSLGVGLAPGHRAETVLPALEAALSNTALPDGTLGFFHPNRFGFGDALYVSQLYGAAMSVVGVASAHITRLAPVGARLAHAETERFLNRGRLSVRSDQIIRLDNDADAPQFGMLLLSVEEPG